MAKQPKGVNFAQDAGASNSDPEKLARLINHAREMARKLKRVSELEAEQKEIQEAYDLLAQTVVPDLMRECGLPSLPLGNGWSIEVEPVFRANLPSPSAIEKAKGEEAEALIQRLTAGLAWLNEEKGGDLVNDTFVISLGKGKQDEAKAISELIERLKLDGERVEKVHHAQLAKFLKEKIAAGKEVPFDTFAVFSGDVAKLVPPPQPKDKGDKQKPKV